MGTSDPQSSAATATRRSYDSSLRRDQAAETRARVLDTAIRMFAERGWSVGVREIAAGAGVSFETVYAKFGSKTRLFLAAFDVAVVGDDRPVPLVERPGFAAMSAGNRRERAAAGAALAAEVYGRTAGLYRALREGASFDPELAARLADAYRRQRSDVRTAGESIAGRTLTDDEAGGLWAVISTEVYDLLVNNAGWSQTRYQNWLADATLRLLGPN
ncbi:MULTISPECIES: TetR/AcrR family transcriptional regulator [Gordonia]|jgi:AcrR family transcriptional regulator|uniref:TetR family transcriptional regulator n=1 Tax=Gordonia alkanivorans CGMCC 6845 TaxID=1423140 RepID=W9DCY6_9ACTN|nr:MULTISPECIES: TetR/AcrR family transcriptional regulator [Gordonia]ETA07293.1 TetR family transcriptional regulator [Gordonia alkanivorans CGMCC 6845]MDH3007806.1 TetR family transcriptional regulator [Gordonia alkanivorans]MDH3020125.1 TetR family transcriptional regulator [Gordonia alkanivorans]MDH3044368.1 TetR family transcriptional regulator [Gordonia alkanivorans]MDH3048739.1 TetR family transcriptional regulator [Gordonia alkanivorans]